MTQMETAAPAEPRRGGETQSIIPTTSSALGGLAQYSQGGTPCSRCKWFYGKKPRERGALFPKCFASALPTA